MLVCAKENAAACVLERIKLDKILEITHETLIGSIKNRKTIAANSKEKSSIGKKLAHSLNMLNIISTVSQIVAK